jgi:hypothetical protein
VHWPKAPTRKPETKDMQDMPGMGAEKK